MASDFGSNKPVPWVAFPSQWWLYFSAAILILILGAADIGLILNLREHELGAAERSLENSSKTLAEEADRTFQSVDLVLSNLVERLDAAGVVDGESYAQLMSGEAVHRLLKEKLDGLPQLDAITLIDADGKLINFSRYWPIPEVNVADRDYFKALKADPSRKSFVSVPVKNRGDGSWTIYLARRVNGLDGRFAGLVLGAMRMQYFEDFYHSVRPGEASAISMIRDDGVLLARYPHSSVIGQTFPDTGGQRALRGGDRGTIREPSPVDGLMRIKAAARVSNFPLVILATTTEAEALGNWSSIAITLSVITGGCALAIALAAAMLGRWSKQQRVLALAREARSAAENARVAAEAELLREREKTADAANRAKSSFLAMMSHEIRTPMNAVLALTDLLLDDTLDPDKRKIVESIRDSGDTLLRILNDILDYSKLEAGQIALETLAFAPGSLGANLHSIMGRRAAAKGLYLDETADADLPEALIGDAGRIRQVLMNLVSNALKFTQRGGITIVTRCLARDADTATVEWIVTDTGIGIPPDKIANLFGDFTQADSSITRRFGGTGLGLAISKRLVEQMNGTMSVSSKEREGTSFRFSLKLPIAESLAAASREPADGEEGLVKALRALARPMRVLVAEDNPTNQFVITQLLKKLDIHMTLANDGFEAVEAASSGSYDLIFMDMQMPEMDGLEATRVIRKLGGPHESVPIVALTANAFPEDVKACYDAGMDDFVVKPIKKARLVSAIRGALAAASRREAQPHRPGSMDDAEARPVIDDDAAAGLAHDLGAETVRGMIAIFLAETRVRLQRLADPTLDAASLMREVHTLAGSARTAFAAELAGLAGGAEARLRREGGNDLPERPRFAEAFRAYEDAVKARDLVGTKAA